MGGNVITVQDNVHVLADSLQQRSDHRDVNIGDVIHDKPEEGWMGDCVHQPVIKAAQELRKMYHAIGLVLVVVGGSDAAGERLRYAGKHTEVGAAAGRAAVLAVTAGVRQWLREYRPLS